MVGDILYKWYIPFFYIALIVLLEKCKCYNVDYQCYISFKTEIGKKAAKKSDLTTSFAYQVNPIAVRVGNDRVGGFVEAGFGYKGFLTAGLSFKF